MKGVAFLAQPCSIQQVCTRKCINEVPSTAGLCTKQQALEGRDIDVVGRQLPACADQMLHPSPALDQNGTSQIETHNRCIDIINCSWPSKYVHCFHITLQVMSCKARYHAHARPNAS